MISFDPFTSSITGWMFGPTIAPVRRPWPFATIPPYALAPVRTRKCVLSAFALAIAAPRGWVLAWTAQGVFPAVPSSLKQLSTWCVRRVPCLAVIAVPGPHTFTLAFIGSNSGLLMSVAGGARWIRDGGGSLCVRRIARAIGRSASRIRRSFIWGDWEAELAVSPTWLSAVLLVKL